MILQCAEVVHLLVVGVVEGDLASAGTLANHLGVGTDPGILAAECNRGEQGRRVALADGLLMPELPDGGAQFVDRHVGESRRLLGAHEQPRHNQGSPIAIGDEPFDHRDLAVFADVDDQPREHRLVVAMDEMGDHDRPAVVHAAGYRQHRLAVERRAQLVEHVVHRAGIEVVALGDEPVGALHRGGRGNRVEAVELQITDAAVAPHLLLGGRQRHRLGTLGGGPALLVSGVNQVGRERKHGRNSTTRVVVIPRASLRVSRRRGSGA